jgi:hypothetical protein
MKDLEELLNAVYIEIRKRNSDRPPQAIPQSDEFFDFIMKKYTLIPFAIPNLIKILVDCHKIVSFKIIEADRKERVRRIEGLVVTEGNIVKKLLDLYSDELIKEYSHEFSTKYSVERIIKEFFPKLDAYNNTTLGKTANIVINLMSIQSMLERNISQYNPKWQETQMKAEIEKSEPISFFIETKDAKSAKSAKSAPKEQNVASPAEEKSQRITDKVNYEEFKKYISKNTIEKTLAVYGIEFYTRVCFREYQFDLVEKLIQEEHIWDKDDLRVIKKMLQKIRTNSDQDLNLQKYAYDINSLEKLVNEKIKQSEER